MEAPHNISLLVDQVDHKHIIFRHPVYSGHYLHFPQLFKITGIALFLDHPEIMAEQFSVCLRSVEKFCGTSVAYEVQNTRRIFIHIKAVDLVRDPIVSVKAAILLEQNISHFIRFLLIISSVIMALGNQNNIRIAVIVHILKRYRCKLLYGLP